MPNVSLDNARTAQDVESLQQCQNDMTKSLQDTYEWLNKYEEQFQGETRQAWSAARDAVEKAITQLGVKYQAGQRAFQEMVSLQNQADARGAGHMG